MFQIKSITPEKTYPLRHSVLRPHQPLSYCVYAGDTEDGAFHLGCYREEKMVGIVSVAPEKHQLFSEVTQYRIRGMATDPSVRGQGCGKLLVVAAMQELKNRNVDLVWFNAREIAFGFYERLGFNFSSDMFEIEGIGFHRVMFANIKDWHDDRY